MTRLLKWIPVFTGITMALSGHIRGMKMVGPPAPPPLWIPASAGMTVGVFGMAGARSIFMVMTGGERATRFPRPDRIGARNDKTGVAMTPPLCHCE